MSSATRMAELSGMRCRLHWSKCNCAPCSELNRSPYCDVVDWASLARGVRGRLLLSEFRFRCRVLYAAPSRCQGFSLGYAHALACAAVCVERHLLSVFREANSPQNFTDKIVSL